MSARLCRPQPDRSRIISSMGLPPREPVPEPTSPTFQQTFPRSRRDSNVSARRPSERSFNTRRAAVDQDSYNEPPRRNRSSRQPDDADSRRRFESLPASRFRASSYRRPAIPEFGENRDRRELDDLDEEDFEDDPRSNRQRKDRSSRREEAPRGKPRSDRGGAAPVNGHRRQESDPYRQPEPYEDFSNASYAKRPAPRSVSHGDLAGDYRRKSSQRPSAKPGSYDTPEARRDDLPLYDHRGVGRSAPKSQSSTGRSGGVLNRVLSRASGGSRDRADVSAPRMERSSSRLNRYSHLQPTSRRDDDEIELARIEEEEMLLAMQKRRSAANQATKGYNESEPRWYRDDRGSRTSASQPRSRTKSVGLERSESAVRRSMNRERQRTLDALERNDRHLPMISRTDAVVRSRSMAKQEPQSRSKDDARRRSGAAPQKATRDAALAAVTGVSAGAVAANAVKRQDRDSKSARRDQDVESDSDVSSNDDAKLQDAPEPADVHDDDAIPIIVANSAKPAQTGKAAPVASSSAQKTSEGLEPAAKPAPAIAQAAVAPAGAAASTSTSKLVATKESGRAAPKGYMTFSRKTPAAAPPAASSAAEARVQSESDASDDSEDDDEDETNEEEVGATPTPSRATPAAAIAALAGGATVGAGTLAAKRSAQAEKDQRKAAKLQAEQEKKAAKAEARAAKAEPALAAKEAKRSEKAKKKEAKLAELERKREEESQARDRAIRDKEEAEERRLLALREKEREREARIEARRASRRPAKGASKLRSSGVQPLTPQQRHYLLKALVMLQMQSEWKELEKLGALTEYGYPFSSHRSKLTRVKTFERREDAGEYAGAARDPYANDDAMREDEDLQEPFLLRHLFHVHLRSFPGLDEAPEKYWQKRIQPFFDEMAARNFSTLLERGEVSKRHLYSLAITRYLGSFVARGFGVRGQGETRGPGLGEPGSEKWGVGKNWGKGTVKRGLDRPARIDPDLMEQIDNLFEGEGGRLWRAAGKEWAQVRRDWCAFKESIIESEMGLEEVISYLDIGNVKNLPSQYRNSVEYVRISAAYIFHALFVTAPNSDDLFKTVKGIHALAPYWGAKQLLKYANAETMISGILSLLLARPGGAKSLIQRVFSYVIGKEASYIQKEFVVPLRKEIGDPELTKKIEDYVRRGDRVESRRMQREARKRGEDVLTTILLAADGKLSKEAEGHVLELQRCFALSPYRGNLNLAYPETTPAGADQPPMPSWGAQGAEHTRARKFALLKLLLRECLKRRDREQAVEIASGSLIPAIIKDSFETVFYPAIRTIAKNANLSERLGDLQKFIDDLLEVKRSGDDSIEAWIALAARHEQSIYVLFHECAPISKRLWDWCQLGLDYMALSTTDPAHPADRRVPNLEINFEEFLQDARLSDSDVKKILAEADKLAKYTKWSKVRFELESRKNYLLGKPEAGHPGGVSELDVTDERLRREVADIDAMMQDLMADAGEKVDDGSCEDGVRGTEKYDFPWAFYDELDPLNQHLAGEEEAGHLRVPKVAVGYAPPSLKHIRRLQPLFSELLASKLPEWQSEDVLGQLQSDVRSGKGNKLSLRSKKPKASFSESASVGGGSSAYPGENKSILSNATSRFRRLRVPSLFGRK
ncbi:hypothetical protein [Sporisorium scitamineum]|uniref:Uncharacterized protein n=1 Tax=Sporisorium scitamineum TaxID=49012 RepID=A0A0F7SBW3_9BASI|nr:hypothetical protein [Sporisorium scitamineum]